MLGSKPETGYHASPTDGAHKPAAISATPQHVGTRQYATSKHTRYDG